MSSSRENDSVKDGGVPDNIALIVMVLSLLAIGSLLMLVFFLEILGNPYSLPILWESGMGYTIQFPFYDIGVPYIAGDPVSTCLALSLIPPMQFLTVQSMSPILQMQIVFYLILGLMLIVLSAGLIKLKNWARIGTIIYCTVSLGYSIITIFPILIRWMYLALFNVNIIVALASISMLPLFYIYFVAFWASILHIILAITIINYLGGDVKYEFEQVDVETLIKDLKKGDKPSRLRAAYLLGVKRNSRAVQPLIEALGDEDWKVQERAIGSLSKIGEPAVGPLIQALESDDLDTRINTVYVLGVIRDSRAVEPLIPVLGDRDWEVREEAARALGRIGDSRAEEPLRLLKKDEDKEVQRAARIALRKIKRKQKGRKK